MSILFENMREIWEMAGVRYKRQESTRNRRKSALEEKNDWRAVEDESRIINRLHRKGMSSEMATSLIATASESQELGSLLLERIINESQLLDISFLRRGAYLSKGVCRVQIRSNSGRVLGHGTGFMISPRLMMTNNHVLRDAGSASTSVAQFDYTSSPDLTEPNPTEFELEPRVFFKTNRVLDFTVVAVAPQARDGSPLSDRPWNPLIRESGKALVGEPVNIIQHPRGEPMKVAIRENRIVDRLEHFLHYETDTERGSSGSQVNNDRWEVAALHHSGVPETNDDGAILLKDGSVWDGGRSTLERVSWIANEGVRISSIVSHLDGIMMTGEERRLYDQAFEPSPFDEIDPNPAPNSWVPCDEHGNTVRKIEPDGSISWYFRVNFGPAGSLTPDALKQIAAQPHAATSNNEPVHDPNAVADVAKSRAEDLLDRFRPDRPYFDAQKDKEDVEAYYDGVNLDVTPAPLFTRLSKLTIERHETELSYKTARLKHLYPWVDLRESRDLRNVYSGTILDPAEIIAQELERYEAARPGTLNEISAEFFDAAELDELELALETTMPFNCEHVVPQSWFGKRQPARADLHHLFTCEPSCNSFRSNIPYFDFAPLLADTPEDDLEIVRRECGQREGDKFEPEMSHGAVARATLYFLLRYPGEIGDESRELQKERLDVLLSWHKTEAPSRYEKHRNQAIFEVQGNRNPFIDFPEFAEKTALEKGFG